MNDSGAVPMYNGLNDDLFSARRVIDIEIEGLQALSTTLGKTFISAMDVLSTVKGHIVVTGMGKSGHIARKIAATLASTGTPAFFVHPAEASHGDLGMITKDDAALVLSNSGYTPELSDLLAYAKQHCIPIIGITSNAESELAKLANLSLILPKCPEACALRLAPTTSTTMTLALGDAIAVALLERTGFSADQFQNLHPGGKLGRLFLKVSDVMHSGQEIPLIDERALMSEVIIEMTAKSLGCIGVISSKKKLVGIITDGDLRRHMCDSLLSKKASEVMTITAKTAFPNMLVSDALAEMNSNKITNLFVIEDHTPVGIIHIHDCLRAGVG